MKHDTPPLIFEKRLGGLFPASAYAEKVISGVSGQCRIEIKKTTGNSRRMSLYWVVLAKAAEALSEICEGDPLDAVLLHRVLKDRRGLYTETILPSGEVIKNYDSISFHKMTENERAEYITWAFGVLAKWLRISVEELTSD